MNTYSSKLGQALPACVIDTVPNDYFEIGCSDVTVMLPFQQAAFAGLNYQCDWFFVPYSYLWSQFPQMLVGRKDLMTDLITTPNAPTMVPSVSLKTLLTEVASQQSLGGQAAELYGSFRLLDLLGYGNYSNFAEVDDIAWTGQAADRPSLANLDSNVRVNIFRLLAYQKIWHDFYRNPYFDLPTSANAFNIDSVGASVGSSLDLGSLTSRMTEWCRLRYVPYRKDLYTGVLPSASFGAVSSISLKDFSLEANFDGSAQDGESINLVAGEHDDALALSQDSYGELISASTWNIDDAFNVLELARAKAAQDWAYTTLRNGNRLSSLWEGHFGTKPNYSHDHVVEFLGSWQGTVKTDVVISNSDTDGAALGTKAATGTVSLHGDMIKHQSHDYGIIMAISSVVPDVQYAATGVDPNNALIEQFDFYTPEFDNTQGFVPLTSADFYPQFSESIDYQLRNLGFVPMWYNYKIKQNLCHGEFCSVPQLIDGTLKGFVLSNPNVIRENNPSGAVQGRSVRSFYVNPDLDANLFSVNGKKQYADHYWHHIYFDIKALRAMSRLGLPNLK